MTRADDNSTDGAPKRSTQDLYEQSEQLVKDEKWDEVIELQRQVVRDETFDRIGNAWFLMGVAYEKKRKYDKAIKCYQNAIVTHGFTYAGDAWNNMGNAYDGNGEYDRAIECYQYALATRDYNSNGKVWYNMGGAYERKGEYDKAIECYHRALDTPGFRFPGNALNNIGNVYGKRGEFDKAIEFCQRALNTPGFDSPGIAWNNMGSAYAGKGEYDKAIECYQKALDTPGYDSPGDVLNNMGNAYGEKGEYDKTIEYCLSALNTPSLDSPGRAYYSIALAYRYLGNLQDARRYMEMARDVYQENGRTDDTIGAEAQIRIIEFELHAGKEATETMYPALSAVTSKRADKDTDYDPSTELQQLEIHQISKMNSYHDEYMLGRKERDPDEFDNTLVLLKGWSSSEPFLSRAKGSNPSIRGGGFLLRWRGCGVAIDPGINYVSNMREEGFYIHDIDAIVATHEHIDHTFDLPALDDLIFQMSAKEERSKDMRRYCFFSEPVAERHKNWQKKKKTYQFATRFVKGEQHCNEARSEKCINDISLIPRASNHCENSFCFKTKLATPDGLPPLTMGFTSDTRYSAALSKFMNDANLIVAHLSMPDTAEYGNRNHLKEKSKHLGLNGTRKLIEGTNASLYVITEFWGGLKDVRVPLCQKLLYDLKQEGRADGKHVIPADVGLRIHLTHDTSGTPLFRIKCTTCEKWTDSNNISVVRPDEAYGPIRYICPDCAKSLVLKPGSA